ncbi:MAG: hypothetical protein U0075_01455 [Thermomicrobiales bacterium]
MDHESFDVLARTVMTNLGTRRGALRVLAGGVFGGVAAHLGLDEQAAAKVKRHGRRPAGHKPDGQAQAASKKHKSKHKHKDRDKDKPRDEICDSGKAKCPDGSCTPIGECCPGSQRCSDGLCHTESCCDVAIPPLCTECQDVVCENGDLVCRSRCLEDEICSHGQCKLPCPSGTSITCPPVPAYDDWKNIFGDEYPLPEGCCGSLYWHEDAEGTIICWTPGHKVPSVRYQCNG